MLKKFKDYRLKMFKKSSFLKYIIYAIGEVFLVVVGILFALQVNNWNEKRKLQNELDSILRTITYDLVADTLSSSNIITYYEQHHENSLKIINKEITKDNFRECPLCANLVTIYQPFTVQKRGFELLKNFSNQNTTQRDSLITNISQFYPVFTDLIEKSNDRLETDVLKNFEMISKNSWFVDLTQGRINDEMVVYFTESEDYRSLVASHDILASQNHLTILKQYKINATEILKLIEERFKK